MRWHSTLLIVVLLGAGFSCSGSDSAKNDAGSADVCRGCDLSRWEIAADVGGLDIPLEVGADSESDAESVTDVPEVADAALDIPGDMELDTLNDGVDQAELDSKADLPDELEEIEETADVPDADNGETSDVASTLPDLSSEGAACGEVLECVVDASCSWEDEACVSGCDDGVSELATWKLDVLKGCYQNKCAGSPPAAAFNCLSQYCTLEVMGCLGGDGDLTCDQVVECITTCPPGSESCRMACMGKAALGTIDGSYAILQQGGFNPFQVWLMECLGGEGDLDCAGAHDCLFGCGFGVPGIQLDQLCIIECNKQTSAQAQEMWMEMMACCEIEVKPSLLVMCLGGTGETTCFSELDCWNACDADDPACYNDCFKQIAPDALEGVYNFFLCMEEICPTEFIPACDLAMDCMLACLGQDVPGGN